MNTNENSGKGRFAHWISTSLTARMFMVGFLTLVLLIPLIYVQELIRERQNRQQEVIGEIGEKWGEEVVVYGPILEIPYKSYIEKIVKDEKTNKVYTETTEKLLYAYVFPEKLDIDANINPEEKYYGIYKTAVYNSEIGISGTFEKPDLKELDINEEDVLWDKLRIVVKTSNLKGVNNKVAINLGKNNYRFESKYSSDKNYMIDRVQLHRLESSYIDRSDLPLEGIVNFNMKLDVKGTKQVSFIPVGKETKTRMQSDWKSANFFGEFLPYNDDKIKDNGFDAKWKVLDINRPFSQNHKDAIPDLIEFSYGVNFIIPVDEYLKSERSSKYGFLVIGLTFLVFFLIQSISKINIHPFQYLMIGLALVMFYTLLISISEHSNFLKAYLISGIAVVVLITLYARSILRSIKFPLFIGISLTALYTFIYVIIQLENYALLVGSIGLFVILAAVMYASRKIDWGN